MIDAATADLAQAPPRPRAGLKVIDEADGYTSAVAGVTIEAIRAGKGVGPNVVLAVHAGQLTITSSCFGFPMTAGAQVPTDRIVVAYIHRNPAGSRWCGSELREGSSLMYSPGAEHVAINQPGLHFTFAVTDPKRLMTVADSLGLGCDLPGTGGLFEIQASPASDRLGSALNGLTRTALDGAAVDRHESSVMVSFADALAAACGARCLDHARGLDSRSIIGDCLCYADATNRVPTIAELCLAARVSERRLRYAFAEEFDCSPTCYFRAWALDRAHHRLRTAGPGDSTVAEVASDLGFNHLGRFSGWYRELYGETPSVTLRAT